MDSIAAGSGISLFRVDPSNPFTGPIPSPDDFDGVVCHHPAAAVRAVKDGHTVGVFEYNTDSLPPGTRMMRLPVALHLFGPIIDADRVEQIHDPKT